MCTVTILHDQDRTIITMNRDERRDRPELEPQKISNSSNSQDIFAPLDAVAKGTWIAMNNHGVVGCLLNRYDDHNISAHESRGHIIPAALEQGSMHDIQRWLRNDFTPKAYQPFRLLVIDSKLILKGEWNGSGIIFSEHLLEASPHHFFSSSSIDEQDVIKWRHTLFEKWLSQQTTPLDHVMDYHLLQPDDMCEWAPFVEREHVHTKSIVQIIQRDNVGHLQYWPSDNIDKSNPTKTLKMAI